MIGGKSDTNFDLEERTATFGEEIIGFCKPLPIDDINKILSTVASNGAPMNVIAKIGQARSVAEATSLASQYLRDPLETAYKKAQIAKIYKDMEESPDHQINLLTLCHFIKKSATCP